MFLADCITESMKSDMNRAVENTAVIEARAKDIALWYEDRNPYARFRNAKDEYEYYLEEEKRIDEMEQHFIQKIRTDANLRREIEQSRKAVAMGDTTLLPEGWVMSEIGSGLTMINAVRNCIISEIDATDADTLKYINSMLKYNDFK